MKRREFPPDTCRMAHFVQTVFLPVVPSAPATKQYSSARGLPLVMKGESRMRFPRCRTLPPLAALTLGGLLASPANAQTFGTNLIVNPGGDFIDANGTVQESTSRYANITDTATMFGWTVTDPGTNSAPTTYRYDSTPGDEDYPLSSEGPKDDQ